jgi:hypothetical protein
MISRVPALGSEWQPPPDDVPSPSGPAEFPPAEPQEPTRAPNEVPPEPDEVPQPRPSEEPQGGAGQGGRWKGSHAVRAPWQNRVPLLFSARSLARYSRATRARLDRARIN